MNRPEKLFRLAVLLALLAMQVGCVTSDEDIDHASEKPNPSADDPSWHGWNSANN